MWLCLSDSKVVKIVSNHLGLNLHLGEDLAVVHTHDGAGNLGGDDHVPQVSLHNVGLLIGGALLLLLVEHCKWREGGKSGNKLFMKVVIFKGTC